MPGVLNSNFNCGYVREVGKMAFAMQPDLMLSEDTTNDIDYIAEQFLQTSSQFLFSGNFGDNADSDSDLPDNELPMDLIKYLDSQDIDAGHKLHRIKCEEDCNICTETPNKYNKYRVSDKKDPFMGTVSSQTEVSGRSSSLLGQLMSPIDYDSEYEEQTYQKGKDTKTFVAWHAPQKTDDEADFMSSKSCFGWKGAFEEDASPSLSFPDTPSPSSQSETITGDDSDVDIETIPDAPRSVGSSGYATQESSPSESPSSSPEPQRKFQSGSLFTILSKSMATSRISGHSSSSSLTACSGSSSALLAENLMSARSNTLGQKRKLSKDKKLTSKAHSVYSHVLCSSNSVNFHDYAMSPGACTYPPPPSPSSLSSSTETARPTVFSKRIYKRKLIAVDPSEKEKQHHHNQLERNRRQKLADLFIDLRDEVPQISHQGKASKVLILKEATVYIRDLQRLDRQQEDEISREKRRKDMLATQLRYLQTQICRTVK